MASSDASDDSITGSVLLPIFTSICQVIGFASGLFVLGASPANHPYPQLLLGVIVCTVTLVGLVINWVRYFRTYIDRRFREMAQSLSEDERILAQILALKQSHPELRLSQLIAVLQELTEQTTGGSLWDLNNHELASLLQRLRQEMLRRDEQTV